MTEEKFLRVCWRKSSFSGGGGTGGGECVEVAAVDDRRVAVRDSKRPGDAVLLSARSEMAAFLRGVKASEFDHLD